SHWLRELDNAALVVALDFTDRSGAQQIAQRAEGLALLLDDLVGNIAESGILDREFGELARMLGLVERPGHGAHRLVDAGLVRIREPRLCDPRTPHQVGGDLLRIRNPVRHLGNSTHDLLLFPIGRYAHRPRMPRSGALAYQVIFRIGVKSSRISTKRSPGLHRSASSAPSSSTASEPTNGTSHLPVRSIA